MARKQREVSNSGIYHVMLRGVNKQRIFENPSDYAAMYRILRYVREIDTKQQNSAQPNYFLYAYCLMDNHVHLLIQPNSVEIGQLMKRIMTAYAQYFNNKYERIGHLFQDRFKSEAVEDDKYFFTLLRYIHNNPVKAGRCQVPKQYPYSSIHEYIGEVTSEKTTKEGQTLIGSLCNMPAICTLKEAEEDERIRKDAGSKTKTPYMNLWITREEIEAYVTEDGNEPSYKGILENLKALTQTNDSNICLYIRNKLNWLTADEKDEQIIATLFELTNTNNITEFQQLDKRTMRSALAVVRDAGVAANKIAHLTGIPIGVIRYAKVHLEPKQPVAKRDTAKE